MNEKDIQEFSKVTNNEISNKLENLIKKISTDISNGFIESVNIDDFRKQIKVKLNNIYQPLKKAIFKEKSWPTTP